MPASLVLFYNRNERARISCAINLVWGEAMQLREPSLSRRGNEIRTSTTLVDTISNSFSGSSFTNCSNLKSVLLSFRNRRLRRQWRDKETFLLQNGTRHKDHFVDNPLHIEIEKWTYVFIIVQMSWTRWPPQEGPPQLQVVGDLSSAAAVNDDTITLHARHYKNPTQHRRIQYGNSSILNIDYSNSTGSVNQGPLITHNVHRPNRIINQLVPILLEGFRLKHECWCTNARTGKKLVLKFLLSHEKKFEKSFLNWVRMGICQQNTWNVDWLKHITWRKWYRNLYYPRVAIEVNNNNKQTL